MILSYPSVEFLWCTKNPLEQIEKAGRTCYKSEHKIEDGSAIKFVQMLLEREHEAMIEHASMSYRIICDRGVTHELVRHRLFSYAQESTRFCNYKNGVEFIIPCWLYKKIRPGVYSTHFPKEYAICTDDDFFIETMMNSEKSYLTLLKNGWKPQQARTVLPNALKTEIVVTGNFREWRHFFRLRCCKQAHPQMREVASLILSDASQHIPVIFDEFLDNKENNV